MDGRSLEVPSVYGHRVRHHHPVGGLRCGAGLKNDQQFGRHRARSFAIDHVAMIHARSYADARRLDVGKFAEHLRPLPKLTFDLRAIEFQLASLAHGNRRRFLGEIRHAIFLGPVLNRCAFLRDDFDGGLVGSVRCQPKRVPQRIVIVVNGTLIQPRAPPPAPPCHRPGIRCCRSRSCRLAPANRSTAVSWDSTE